MAIVLVFAQTNARQIFLESSDYPTLRALGLTRAQLFAIGFVRAVSIAAVGAAIAVGVAIALSPLLPTGTARIAEPTLGIRVDATAIALGAAAIVVLVAVLSLWPAWRAARVRGSADQMGARSSSAGKLFARAGLSPSAVSGVRLALERGRGSTAVPVGTSLMGVTLGITALVTALCFASSLTFLLKTPELYGLRWDAVVSVNTVSVQRDPVVRESIAPQARALPSVESIATGTSGLPMTIDGVSIEGLGLSEPESDLAPRALTGRTPTGTDEVLLGAKTLLRIHRKVGDTVQLGIQGTPKVAMRIVGTGVIPPLGEVGHFGEGAFLDYVALPRICSCEPPPPDTLYVRFRPGVSTSRGIAELQANLTGAELSVSGPLSPDDLVNFGHVQNLPLVLAGLLAVLAAMTLAHVLVTSIRRRRRDLAILKTVGFVRGQVRRTVAWQATTLAWIALVAGIPLGVVTGRWLWITFAHGLGVLVRPRVPTIAVILAAPATMILANLVALLPARAAARTQPADVLRIES